MVYHGHSWTDQIRSGRPRTPTDGMVLIRKQQVESSNLTVGSSFFVEPGEAIKMSKRLRRTNPEGVHPPAGYSHVVEVQPGRVAYVSGQVAFNKAGELVGEGDIVAQTRQVFENLKSALSALGTDFDSVIKVNYYAVDVSRLTEIREVRAEYLKSAPASTFVVVKGLVRPELLIEIEAVVALPD